MAKKDKKKKKGNTLSVNFEGVKAFKTIPEGSYVLRITAAEKGESANDNETINWEFEVASGEHEGSKLWATTSLSEKALWKLRELLEAAGQDVPDDEMDIDLDDLVGNELGAIVYHEEYEGKNRAKIGDFIAVSEVEGADDEDDKKSKKKGKKSKDDDDEKDDDKDVPDVDNMDEDELTEFVSEAGLDVDLDDYKNLKKKRAAVKEALEADDDKDDDKDSEDEKYSEDDIMDMDTEALSKINDDHDLGIEDIEDMKPRAARKAMMKALKKAKLLED